jgi:hypothetical protein
MGHLDEELKSYFRCLSSQFWNIRKPISRIMILLPLALLGSAAVVNAAGAPFFQSCNVTAVNLSDGMHLQMTARISDPNGSMPGSIASVVVSGPGGFSYNLTSTCQPGGGCSTITPDLVTPASGLYTFAVTDLEGKIATSTSYLQVNSPVPVLDAASLLATGSASNLSLSWSPPADYAGNLFYMATIRDDNGTMVFMSQSNPNTAVTGITLNPSHTYQWWVQAFDQYSPPLSENASVTDPKALDPSALNAEQPYFQYATVFNRHKGDGTFVTNVAARVVDPNGTLPSSITSLTITGPGGFSDSFAATDYDSSPNSLEFSKQVPGKPVDGIYKFTVTDADNHTATTYDYLLSRDVPLIGTGTMQASGNPLQPTLSWGLPADMTAPLYFVAIVYNATDPANPIEVWRSDIITNTAVQMPAGKLTDGVSYAWRVRALDSRYSLQWNRSETEIIAMTFDNATPFFTWYGVYYRHDHEGYWICLDAQVRDPDGTLPSTIQSLTVAGPNNFAYTFLPADYAAGDDEYFKRLPGTPASGVYTFTVTDVDSNSAVTHSYLNPPQGIPIVDPAALAVNGDPLAPTVSWNAIAGYPGRLHYRLRVVGAQENPVWSSGRGFGTAVTVPVGWLTAGNPYFFRVEAQDNRDYPIYTSRSNPRYYPLTVPFVLPAPDLNGKWKILKSTNLGKTISGQMQVNNIGNDNAGAFTVKCYISKDGRKLGKLIKTIKVSGGLTSGQSNVLKLSYKSKTSLKNYYIVAVLDAAKVVAEKNEANNAMPKKVR